MSFFRAAWRGYLGLLERRPLTTKCTTSGIIMVAGDAIQQGIEYAQRSKEHELATEAHHASPLTVSKPKTLGSFRDGYDVPRSFRSGVFGALAVGPIFHVWFRTLDRLVPGGTFKPVALKMLIDQGFMAPTFTVFYFAVMGLMEGKAADQIQAKIVTATWPTLVANYCIFPFTQFYSLMFVPQHLRVLVLNAGGLVYNVYLSRFNAEDTEVTAQAPQLTSPEAATANQ